MKTIFKIGSVVLKNASSMFFKLLEYAFDYTVGPANITLVGSISYDPVLSNNRLLVTEIIPSRFYMLNASDGSIIDEVDSAGGTWNNPYGSAFDPVAANNRFFLCSAETSRVVAFDANTLEEVAYITGFGAYDDYVTGICFDPIISNNRLVVARFVSNKITVIDATSLDLAAGTDVTGFNQPYDLTFNKAGTKLFIGNYGGNTISVVDPATFSIIGTVTGFNGPRNLSFHPKDENILFVTNFGTNTISIVDTLTLTIIQTLTVTSTPTGLAFDRNVSGVPRFFTAGYSNGDIITATQL